MAISIATLAELINDAETELAAANERLQRAHAELAEIRAERDALVAVFRRREKAVSSNGQIALPQIPAPEFDEEASGHLVEKDGEWLVGPQTDVVERVLRHLWEPGRTVGPAEIHEFLTQAGRDDKKDHISAALAHLSRRGRVHRLGAAQWAPGPAPEDAEDPAVTGPSDDATTSGQEGGAGTHAQASIRDHGYPVQGEDRHHDRGAPVAVGG